MGTYQAAATLNESLRALYQQVVQGLQPNRQKAVKLLFAPIKEEAVGYEVCDGLGSTAASLGLSVLICDFAPQGQPKRRLSGRHLELSLKGHSLIEEGISYRSEGGYWELAIGVSDGPELQPLGQSKIFQQSLAHLSSLFDLMLFNAPPLGEQSPGGRGLAELADKIVLLARKGKTRKDDLARVVKATEGLPVLGFVLLE